MILLSTSCSSVICSISVIIINRVGVGITSQLGIVALFLEINKNIASRR